MGSMSIIIPQGPNRHCGNTEPHDRHENLVNVTPLGSAEEKLVPGDGSWCDGIPPLQEFVELTVRVPLSAYFGDEKPEDLGLDHRAVLQALGEETGYANFILELADASDSSWVLRLRAAGQDRVYQCPEGKLPDGECAD
jgi:hypothetical protein